MVTAFAELVAGSGAAVGSAIGCSAAVERAGGLPAACLRRFEFAMMILLQRVCRDKASFTPAHTKSHGQVVRWRVALLRRIIWLVALESNDTTPSAGDRKSVAS
jgi:hypothetical protein